MLDRIKPELDNGIPYFIRDITPMIPSPPKSTAITTPPYPNGHEITKMLARWSDGDTCVLPELFPVVYTELRQLAGRLMRHERKDHTLQPTALVHEAYLSLSSSGVAPEWRDRIHFYAVSAQLMRRILVDHARALQTSRRGSGARKFSLKGFDVSSPERAANLLELDQGLSALEAVDPRKARVVELRFFGGLSVAECAEVLTVSKPTIILDTRLARAWLYDFFHQDAAL